MDFFQELKEILFGAGAVGAILLIHLVLFLRRMDRQEEEQRHTQAALHLMAQVDLLRLVASPHVAEEVKQQASLMLTDIDTAKTEAADRAEEQSKLPLYKPRK